MSDTLKTIRQSDALNNRGRIHLVDRKTPARAFTVKTRKEILYRYAWQGQEPERIAQQFSRGPIRATSKLVNSVIREHVIATWKPDEEAA